MENNKTLLLLPHSTVLIKNIDAVHTYLKNTFSDTKKEIGEGLSFFKEEITDKINKTGEYLNHLVMPVNNFIKDLTQIDKEFEAERLKSNEYCICLNGQMVPASEVLNMPMEENY